jgi:hypothetical protein
MGILTLKVFLSSFFVVPVLAYFLSYWIPGWQALLIGNATIGIIALEYAWSLIPRYLVANEARDSMFPAFRRLDSHKWRKWMFYPGAVTLFPIRTMISLGTLVLLVIFLRIIMIGHKWGKEPFTGLRLWLNRSAYQFCSWLIITTSFMTMTVKQIEYDYS